MAKTKRLGDEPGDENIRALKSETPSEDRFRAIRERFEEAQNACLNLYNKAQDDFEFAWVDGKQWDDNLGVLRDGRPKYEFNILRQTIKQVINDNRQNTPSIKVRAVEDGDVAVAEIRQGLIRNIEMQSNADQAYDWGGMYAITAGYGAWRVATQYASDDSFDQDICIKRIEDPFSVIFDPASRELNRSDARYAFVIQKIPRAEFRDKYPNAETDSWDGMTREAYYGGWYDDDEVRVVEYWQKHADKKTIYRLSDGSVVDGAEFDKIADAAAALPEPITIEARREVDYDRITYEICSGDETLEGPFDWAGKYIPLVPCWGDMVSVRGAPYWYGMVRHSRDAQLLFNYGQSNLVEVIAKQPNAPWLYTPKMIEGHDKAWAESAVNNSPGLPYNVDPEAPGGAPRREMPPQFPNAWFDLARINNDNLKAVTGIHDASLGKQSNETSGRAIIARQQEGDVATYDYSDNIVRAVQYTGVIINDLIPHIYDVEREIRILGDDMTEKYVKVNKPIQVPVIDPATGLPKIDMLTGEIVQEWKKTNDLTVGKYDVEVTTGPSYTTMRMETLNAMTELARSPGPSGMLGALGVMEFMDVPGMQPFANAMRKMLISQGVPLEPKEGEEPAPQGPPPEMVEQMQQMGAELEKTGQKLAETQKQLMQAQINLTQAGNKQAADLAKVEVDRYNAVTERMKVQGDLQIANVKVQIEDRLADSEIQLEGAHIVLEATGMDMDDAHRQREFDSKPLTPP